MLAAASASPDGDRNLHGGSGGGGDVGGSAANGASGFRFVGMVVGLLARNRVVATGFGAYGAASSIYYHFLARGRDVVYPKDMAMVIGLGTRESKPSAATAPEHPADQAAAKEGPIRRCVRGLTKDLYPPYFAVNSANDAILPI